MNPLANSHCVFSVSMGVLLAVWSNIASAQSDRVFDRSGKTLTGEVTQTNPKGIQVKKGSDTQTLFSSDIKKIQFQGEPSGLTKGRQLALDGQYEQALEQLKKVQPDSIERPVIEADFSYYRAYCTAKLALAGKTPKAPAVKAMLTFARDHDSSWHLFDAAKLLGDLALALGDQEKALKYYSQLANAASADTKILSRYLQARVHLVGGNHAQALDGFDSIINLNAQTPATVRLQILAKAGKSVAMSAQGQAEQGLQLVDSLIVQLNSTDIEMAARIYNAQGASFEAAGDTTGALLAYLHTHLMFSSQPDAHAQALGRLVDLWTQTGKPDRAAEARQELQQRYPGVK